MEVEIISWIIKGILTLVFGYVLFRVKENYKETKALEAKVAQLEKYQVESENKFVTEERMKMAVTEALEPYKESQQEIKMLITNLTEQVTSLSKDVAVQLALGRMYGNRDSNNSDR